MASFDLLDVDPRETDAEAASEHDAVTTTPESDRLAELQATFERSEWADRAPEDVEIEIHLALAGQVFICKLDAVYRTESGYQVVDWKTGRAPTDARDLELKQTQLALYRLAYARWKNVDPSSVDAVFYFVADDVVIRPERIYEEEDLLALWSSVSSRHRLGTGCRIRGIRGPTSSAGIVNSSIGPVSTSS